MYKPFFHGGVKQYKTHARTATITSYLSSYIHYKLKYNYYRNNHVRTIAIKYNHKQYITNKQIKQTVKYNTNNIQKHTA